MKKIAALILALMLLCAATALAGDVKVGHLLGAPHGAQGFAEVTVVLEDGVIIAVYLDEYQFMSKGAEGVVPVPNSDAAFGSNVVEGMALASKRESTVYYSGAMAGRGATVAIDANYDAIQAFCVGKTVEELKAAQAALAEKAAGIEDAAEKKAAILDAVSGATLTDTPNYLAK